jgi:hypothetical protein
MERAERDFKYHKKNDFKDEIIGEFYGEWSFDNFKKNGCEILKNYQPFQMLEIVDLIYDRFNEKNKHINKLSEILITLPETLYCLDHYMAEKIDNEIYFNTNVVREGFGLKKGYKLCFSSQSYIPYGFIWGNEYKEVIFIFFYEHDIKNIHNHFFTSKVFMDRSSRGMD